MIKYTDITDSDIMSLEQQKMAELFLNKELFPDLCVICHQPFTDENVFTELGWKETKISHICEKCFNRLFSDD